MRVTGAWSKTVLIATLAVIAGAAQAAPITAITGDPAISGEVDVETTLTSITTDAGTEAVLVGASEVHFATDEEGNEVDPGRYFWQANGGSFVDGTTPVQSLLEGLSLTTGIANAGFTAMFSDSRVTVDSTFFFFEIGGSDDFTVAPVNSAGDALGTWELSVVSGDYGPTVISTTDVEKNASGTASHDIGGLTFSLDEFTGSGDLSDFAGFQFDMDGGDAVLVGAVVPEPTTLAISALGLVGLVRRRRR
jgi:hypothetical protein